MGVQPVLQLRGDRKCREVTDAADPAIDALAPTSVDHMTSAGPMCLRSEPERRYRDDSPYRR
jgi:hypothetical protein